MSNSNIKNEVGFLQYMDWSLMHCIYENEILKYCTGGVANLNYFSHEICDKISPRKEDSYGIKR